MAHPRNRSTRLLLWILLFSVISWPLFKPKEQLFLHRPAMFSLHHTEVFAIQNSFRQQLIAEWLKSYAVMYDLKPVQCKYDRHLDSAEQARFTEMTTLLEKIRESVPDYPKNHFYGRGIVLTIGEQQLNLAKINLQMIAFTSTRLPVQVSIHDHFDSSVLSSLHNSFAFVKI